MSILSVLIVKHNGVYLILLTVFNYVKDSHLPFFLQDPTKQVEIDNFMVQQLDGTSNEWGWCKQKVLFILTYILLQNLILVHHMDILLGSNCALICLLVS